MDATGDLEKEEICDYKDKKKESILSLQATCQSHLYYTSIDK